MKLVKFTFPVLIALTLLSGCITAPKKAHTTPFSLSDLEPYGQKGTSKIHGQAFLTTKGGDVKVGAGRTVSLIPATAFVKETRSIRDAGFIPTSMTDEVAAQLNKYVRESIADAQGNYEFNDIPAGDYLIETSIQWQYGQSAAHVTGGLISKFVSVKEGETQKIVLTR